MNLETRFSLFETRLSSFARHDRCGSSLIVVRHQKPVFSFCRRRAFLVQSSPTFLHPAAQKSWYRKETDLNINPNRRTNAIVKPHSASALVATTAFPASRVATFLCHPLTPDLAATPCRARWRCQACGRGMARTAGDSTAALLLTQMRCRLGPLCHLCYRARSWMTWCVAAWLMRLAGGFSV